MKYWAYYFCNLHEEFAYSSIVVLIGSGNHPWVQYNIIKLRNKLFFCCGLKSIGELLKTNYSGMQEWSFAVNIAKKIYIRGKNTRVGYKFRIYWKICSRVQLKISKQVYQMIV